MKSLQELYVFLLDLEAGNEHCCPECFKDVSSGREFHKPECKLKLGLDYLEAQHGCKDPY